MTEQNTCLCGRPSRDATLCPACAHVLDAAIAEVCEGLAEDLDVALSRQDRIDRPSSSRHPQEGDDGRQWPGTLKPTPSPYDPRASTASDHLRGVLACWTLVIVQETRDDPPTDHTLAGLAAWLRPRVGWLRHHVAGADAYAEITDAVKQARIVIDRPADKLYAGPCDCGEDLYARLDAAYVVCTNTTHGDDGIAWEVEARRSWLLKSAEDVLATTTEISRALTRYAQPITPSAIRGYVARGRLFPKGEQTQPGRKDPVPLYRLGDVLKLVAPDAERVNA